MNNNNNNNNCVFYILADIRTIQPKNGTYFYCALEPENIVTKILYKG